MLIAKKLFGGKSSKDSAAGYTPPQLPPTSTPQGASNPGDASSAMAPEALWFSDNMESPAVRGTSTPQPSALGLGGPSAGRKTASGGTSVESAIASQSAADWRIEQSEQRRRELQEEENLQAAIRISQEEARREAARREEAIRADTSSVPVTVGNEAASGLFAGMSITAGAAQSRPDAATPSFSVVHADDPRSEPRLPSHVPESAVPSVPTTPLPAAPTSAFAFLQAHNSEGACYEASASANAEPPESASESAGPPQRDDGLVPSMRRTPQTAAPTPPLSAATSASVKKKKTLARRPGYAAGNDGHALHTHTSSVGQPVTPSAAVNPNTAPTPSSRAPGLAQMAVTPEASEVADHLTAAQEILFKSAAHSRAFSAEEATNARASAPAIEGTGSGHAEGLGIATSVVRDQMPAENGAGDGGLYNQQGSMYSLASAPGMEAESCARDGFTVEGARVPSMHIGSQRKWSGTGDQEADSETMLPLPSYEEALPTYEECTGEHQACEGAADAAAQAANAAAAGYNASYPAAIYPMPNAQSNRPVSVYEGALEHAEDVQNSLPAAESIYHGQTDMSVYTLPGNISSFETGSALEDAEDVQNSLPAAESIYHGQTDMSIYSQPGNISSFSALLETGSAVEHAEDVQNSLPAAESIYHGQTGMSINPQPGNISSFSALLETGSASSQPYISAGRAAQGNGDAEHEQQQQLWRQQHELLRQQQAAAVAAAIAPHRQHQSAAQDGTAEEGSAEQQHCKQEQEQQHQHQQAVTTAAIYRQHQSGAAAAEKRESNLAASADQESAAAAAVSDNQMMEHDYISQEQENDEGWIGLGRGADVLPQIIDQIGGRLEAGLQALQTEASAMTSQQARMRQEREAIVTRLRHTISHKEVVETAQLEAEEREDYSKAEDLVVHAAALRSEVEQLERGSAQLARGLERIADQRLLLYERQAAICMHVAENMEGELLKRKAEHQRESDAAVVQGARAEEVVVEQLDSLAHELQHIQFDKEKIGHERTAVEDAVAGRTAQERKELEELEAQHKVVRDEMEEILALLKRKEAEEAELTRRLAEAGERVLLVRESFAPELARLEERHMATSKREAECHSRQTFLRAEQDRVRQQRMHREQHLASVAAAVELAEQRVSSTRSSAQQWTQQVSELTEHAKCRHALVLEEDAALDTIDKLRERINKEMVAKEGTAQRILDLQHHVSRGRTDLASIDAQLPGIEERKKLAVTAKNFKEAGRLAAEVKALGVRREEMVLALKVHNDTLQRVLASFAQHEAQHAELTSEMSKAQDAAATLKLQHLQSWCQSLKLFLEQAHVRGDVEAHREWAAQKSICESDISELIRRLPKVEGAAVPELEVDPLSEPEQRQRGNLGIPSVGILEALSSPSPPQVASVGGSIAARSADGSKVGLPAPATIEIGAVAAGEALQIQGMLNPGQDGSMEVGGIDALDEETRKKAAEEEEIAMEMRRAMFVAETKRLQLEREQGVLGEVGAETNSNGNCESKREKMSEVQVPCDVGTKLLSEPGKEMTEDCLAGERLENGFIYDQTMVRASLKGQVTRAVAVDGRAEEERRRQEEMEAREREALKVKAERPTLMAALSPRLVLLAVMMGSLVFFVSYGARCLLASHARELVAPSPAAPRLWPSAVKAQSDMPQSHVFKSQDQNTTRTEWVEWAERQGQVRGNSWAAHPEAVERSLKKGASSTWSIVRSSQPASKACDFHHRKIAERTTLPVTSGSDLVEVEVRETGSVEAAGPELNGSDPNMATTMTRYSRYKRLPVLFVGESRGGQLLRPMMAAHRRHSPVALSRTLALTQTPITSPHSRIRMNRLIQLNGFLDQPATFRLPHARAVDLSNGRRALLAEHKGVYAIGSNRYHALTHPNVSRVLRAAPRIKTQERGVDRRRMCIYHQEEPAESAEEARRVSVRMTALSEGDTHTEGDELDVFRAHDANADPTFLQHAYDPFVPTASAGVSELGLRDEHTSVASKDMLKFAADASNRKADAVSGTVEQLAAEASGVTAQDGGPSAVFQPARSALATCMQPPALHMPASAASQILPRLSTSPPLAKKDIFAGLHVRQVCKSSKLIAVWQSFKLLWSQALANILKTAWRRLLHAEPMPIMNTRAPHRLTWLAALLL